MLKIYHAPLSGAANKVRMCANALGLDYEAIAVDLTAGEQRAAAYLDINPFGKVPAIDDDGFYLFESNAIMKYLCRKHDSDLYPDEMHAQAVVDQWCDFAASLLVPALGRLLFNRVLAPIIGAPVSEESIADGLRFVGNYLPVLEARLGESDHVAGPGLTIADLAILGALDPAEACQVELSGFTRLYRWREALRARPFYADVHAYYGEGVLPLTASRPIGTIESRPE